MNDTRARINLALSILTHADEERLDRAATEARLALDGFGLGDLLTMRCHIMLGAGVICGECGVLTGGGE